MRRSWGFGGGPGGWGWPGGLAGFATGGRRRQWFGAGDMKYVILELVKDKPRHGYEVMKELEERMHGCYSPSPGTVYPTLQLLEDEGLVKAKEVDGKKVYEITPDGLKFLAEHKDVVEDIFDRVRDVVDQALGGSMVEVNESMGRLVKAVYRRGWRANDEARRKIAAILARAMKEIEEATT